ncbi:MAG: hypothetical protein HC804_13355 [Anaerolineae bacterium]|nr:hypothetical protein [Anaerolineae bacterium]
MIKTTLLLMLFLFCTAVACQQPPPTPTPTPTPQPTHTPSPTATPQPVLGAGMRYSSYGPWYDPGPTYWAGVAQQMAANFPGAVPQAVWIVGTVGGAGHVAELPWANGQAVYYFTSEDKNEEVLTLFDEMGGQVWLQVEPGRPTWKS